MGWKAVSQILVILGSKYVGISLFQFDITELFNIELMEWFLVQKVALEIRDNSIQVSSSYAGPSVHICLKSISINHNVTPKSSVKHFFFQCNS